LNPKTKGARKPITMREPVTRKPTTLRRGAQRARKAVLGAPCVELGYGAPRCLLPKRSREEPDWRYRG